jgi:predicted ATP-binding protein involved in virulence
MQPAKARQIVNHKLRVFRQLSIVAQEHPPVCLPTVQDLLDAVDHGITAGVP